MHVETPMLMRYVDKIAASPVLRGSEGLCKLLRHLAETVVQEPSVSTSEFRIATEVLGRRSDFNPKIDSSVRAQISRLRSKLEEYYTTIGAEDEIIIDMPKRGLGLTFQKRKLSAEVPSRRWLLVLAAAISGLLALVWIFQALRYRQLLDASTTALQTLGLQPSDLPALRQFWAPFLQNPQGPLVVYSNGEFTGSPVTGMHLLMAGEARENIVSSYTGVGEVVAVHALDRVFAAMRTPLRVKRGGLLPLDDAQENDIIFVGSPVENPPLQDLPINEEFVFQPNPQPAMHNGYWTIGNVHPRPGEPLIFVSDKANPPAYEFALVALAYRKRRHVLTLAGTTTFGTQAAAEFVSSPDSLRELVGRAGSKGDTSPPFEAVLQVQLKKGVPISTRIVTVHPAKNQ